MKTSYFIPQWHLTVGLMGQLYGGKFTEGYVLTYIGARVTREAYLSEQSWPSRRRNSAGYMQRSPVPRYETCAGYQDAYSL